MKKRVFYFNINYSCNNKCIFCYSHNTIYKISTQSELNYKDFIDLIKRNKITTFDRIILNGGEPLLHSEINKFLDYICKTGIETIIFSNGRMLKKLDPKLIKSNLRFVIPIHGYEDVHDRITGVSGSYNDTLTSLNWINENGNGCLVDMKIILNNETVKNNIFLQSVDIWKSIPFNNALHITMMADTTVSKLNGCPSLSLDEISNYTHQLFEIFKHRCIVKIYDTCINSFSWLKNISINKYKYDIELHYKDFSAERLIKLKRPNFSCDPNCEFKENCLSGVSEYKVLEISKNKIYENVE